MTKIKVKSAPIFIPICHNTDCGDWFCSGCGKWIGECDGSCDGNNPITFPVDIYFGSRESDGWYWYKLRYETGF